VSEFDGWGDSSGIFKKTADVPPVPSSSQEVTVKLESGALCDMLEWCATPKKEEDKKSVPAFESAALGEPGDKAETAAPFVPRRTTNRKTNGPSKAEIRRCARRGGVTRMAGTVYEEARKSLAAFLRPVLRDSVVFATHAQRKTVFLVDVLHALKRNNRTLYGVAMK
jgi:histone H4